MAELALKSGVQNRFHRIARERFLAGRVLLVGARRTGLLHTSRF